MINNVIIDTNILIRYLHKDNLTMHKKAKHLFLKIGKKELVGYLTVLTIHETIYILKHVYHIDKKLFVEKIKQIIRLKNIEIFNYQKDTLETFLERYENMNVDFPDIVNISHALENNMCVATFDKDYKNTKTKLYSL